MVAPADNPAPPAGRKTAVRIPLPLKLKARSLYLIHGLPYSEISAQTGLSPQSVRNLAFTQGWTKTKAKTRLAMEKRADVRMNEEITEITEGIAVESEQIAMAGLKRARESTEAVHEDAAKDFQAWTGGARNLVNIARACRGLDAPRGGAGCGSDGEGRTINLQFFVGNVGASVARSGGMDTAQASAALPGSGARDCKTVGPVLEVETRPAS